MPPSAQIRVEFTFHSGIRRPLFSNVRLTGSWNEAGQFSSQWSQAPMTATTDASGCEAFVATVSFDAALAGTRFDWGVVADLAQAPDAWVIPTEVADENSADRTRHFVLDRDDPSEHYWFATGRRFGAQKHFQPGSSSAGLQFALWAPNAKRVEVVFAPFDITTGVPTGYIADDGTGADASAPSIPLTASSKKDGTWETDIAAIQALGSFNSHLNHLYMYRVTNEQGNTTYRVDLFSRSQAGRGATNPGGAHYPGSYLDLDGIVSCSVIADPDQVTQNLADCGVRKQTLIPEHQFWAGEYTPGRLPPTRIEDLIIYELHVGSLGFPLTSSGTFADAIAFVERLTELGVNAVELLPILQYDGDSQWGYGTSLFFCMQSSAGGANQLKHFVRACHQRGIAVILDVAYNHFATSDNERSEWGYDSDPSVAPQHNTWYWYEGQPKDYGPANPQGGYLNNGSSGWTPRFSEENVRQMFTSSAAALLDDFHIDGLRVDLTDAIHQNNTLNANGAQIPAANLYGIKFLRELARTVKAVNPSAFLIAEDHTGWSAITQPLEQGGIGFDAAWYSDFYHHLIGDGNYGDAYAGLLKKAGYGADDPLNMEYFAGALLATQYRKIVYHENHDEAGNDQNTERTMVTAVNHAPLVGATRKSAEARSRFAFGMSTLSAGTPMLLMGEEIGAARFFRYDDFQLNKEDLIAERAGEGRWLFRFYQDLIRLAHNSPAIRSRTIDVIHTHDVNRMIAFVRSTPGQELLVMATLHNKPFDQGYFINTDWSRLQTGSWRELFNSDAAIYGGDNVGNLGMTLSVRNGQFDAVIPASGFVVFERIN